MANQHYQQGAYSNCNTPINAIYYQACIETVKAYEELLIKMGAPANLSAMQKLNHVFDGFYQNGAQSLRSDIKTVIKYRNDVAHRPAHRLTLDHYEFLSRGIAAKWGLRLLAEHNRDFGVFTAALHDFENLTLVPQKKLDELQSNNDMTVLQQKISKLQNKQKSDNAEIHRLQQKIRDQNKTIARLNEINDHKIKLDNDKKREIKALHKQMEKLERNYASTFSEITKESESMIDDKHKEIRNLQMALNYH
eukprot:793728_1